MTKKTYLHNVPWPDWPVAHSRRGLELADHRLRQILDGRLRAGAHVEHVELAVPGQQRGDDGAGHVLDVHKVSRLPW